MKPWASIAVTAALALCALAGAQDAETPASAVPEDGPADAYITVAPPEIDMEGAIDLPPTEPPAEDEGIPEEYLPAGEEAVPAAPDAGAQWDEVAGPGFRDELDRQMGMAVPGEGGVADGAENRLPPGGLGENALRALGGLCIVLALILIVYYLLRRFGRYSPALAGQHLGKVMGRVSLTPRASLYFVRAGGRVLIVGVTPASVNLVSEMDESAFESPAAQVPASDAGGSVTRFADHLQASVGAMKSGETAASPEDDIASLRGDIERLQNYLRESSRDQGD